MFLSKVIPTLTLLKCLVINELLCICATGDLPLRIITGLEHVDLFSHQETGSFCKPMCDYIGFQLINFGQLLAKRPLHSRECFLGIE